MYYILSVRTIPTYTYRVYRLYDMPVRFSTQKITLEISTVHMYVTYSTVEADQRVRNSTLSTVLQSAKSFFFAGSRVEMTESLLKNFDAWTNSVYQAFPLCNWL